MLAGLPLAFEEVGSVLQQLALPGTDHGGVNLETGGNLGCGLVTLEGGQARATLDLNDALYCLRFLLMILLLVEMMNQSLGTCPKFGVHFNLLAHHDELQWPLKVFAWSNRILHKVSTERNPLRECFIMRSENVAKMIRGEVTYGGFRKNGEDTAKCIGDAQKIVSQKYGTSVFEGLRMTERDQQSLRRIIGLAKAMASE
ncbi:MAG: hypothetical protein AWU57_1306 [Marinobacter sp. T13-3]|nr:MAG: hypothetical protein AWU57_1306 [Marinobacter sp. T13-3]